jgi:sucrose phosphorylase
MKNQVQLITYVDRLAAGGIADLAALLRGPLAGLFGGVHLLPFFDPIDGSDAGFDPIDHTAVDRRLGNWSDIKALAADVDLVADLIVNHIARESPQCRDFLANGMASRWAPLFLTRERIFPAGPRPKELAAIYRPQPGPPFTEVTLATGARVHLWTTFTSSQVDIDVTHPLGAAYLDGILDTFAANGVRLVRLDAVGFAIKKAGTSCFMLPETLAFIANLRKRAHARGMQVLAELHAHHLRQMQLAPHVDWVYDFALPPLVLHAFTFRTAEPLRRWLRMRPRNALNVLDTHDGIGITDIGAEADMPGLVPAAELRQLVETIHANSGESSRLASGAAAANLDFDQINCTYYDALARNDRRYLMARALQFFVPGIPQLYYVGFLAGGNDMALLARTGEGRDINRHYFSRQELGADLERPVVQALCALIRLRNTHPAFGGKFLLPPAQDGELVLRWESGSHFAELHLGFHDDRFDLRTSDIGNAIGASNADGGANLEAAQ